MPPPKKKKTKRRSPNQEKVSYNLSLVVKQFINGRGYEPLSASELEQRLSIPHVHQELFQKVLAELATRGEILCKEGRYSSADAGHTVVTGTLKVHPRGFGFLQPENPTPAIPEVFIPKHLTRNAVDGDTVEVLVDMENVSPKGPEGRVLSIVKRGRTHLAGTIRAISGNGKVYAHVPLLGTNRTVIVSLKEGEKTQVGDRVILKILKWGESQDDPLLCEKMHDLGHISDPSCDISAAIEEFGLRATFPREVLRQAEQCGTKVKTSDFKGREDLRSIVSFTIDPDTAKDYDDALSITQEKDGGFSLGVHIADVSHYVLPDTPLDLEAKKRCNSTYFPGYCLPMLPYELSNELCSLKPRVNRLAVSVLMRFDKEGTLQTHRIVRSVIKSRKRFTYKEAKAVLDGKKKSPFKKDLEHLVALCRLLKLKRYERGSIEFALPEVVIVCDEKGMPHKTEKIEYDITHQLVEEFMLKANEIVATHLSDKGIPLPFRIHEEPSEDNIREFAAFARALGFKLPQAPTTRDLQALFDEAMKTPFGPQLAVSYIRSMKLAAYSPTNLGHYGLSLEYYCHFTSPIRRYIDLVIHRTICGNGLTPIQLQEISQACSEQERISSRSEQNVSLIKKLRLLQALQQKDIHQHVAYITRIKPAGLIFELDSIMLEGFLHISEIGDDYFIFDERLQMLFGRHTGLQYRMGQKVSVELLDLDLITLETHFRLSSNRETKRKK